MGIWVSLYPSREELVLGKSKPCKEAFDLVGDVIRQVTGLEARPISNGVVHRYLPYDVYDYAEIRKKLQLAGLTVDNEYHSDKRIANDIATLNDDETSGLTRALLTKGFPKLLQKRSSESPLGFHLRVSLE